MLNIKRYLRHLQSYSNRQRRRNASKWIEKICHANWKVVELECGSGLLAAKLSGARYTGIDSSRSALKKARSRLSEKNVEFIEADPRQIEIPEADLVVFLGLLEKISLQDFAHLLGRIRSKRILFAFTEPPREQFFRWPERLLFRGLQHRSLYHTDVISELLEQYGYKKREIRRSQWYGPGKMVLAEKRLKKASAPRPRQAHSAP